MHRILLESEVDCPAGTQELLEKVISAALEAEGVEADCEINRR